MSGCFGATTGNRTRDLIITNDVLYQLSHSSISIVYYTKTQWICQVILHYLWYII